MTFDEWLMAVWPEIALCEKRYGWRTALEIYTRQAWHDRGKLVAADLADYIATAFRSLACEIPDDDNASELTGWWDNCANGTTDSLGEWLVDYGTWERHPTRGHGGRQFYRPKKGDDDGSR